jgi:hypothetical protein
VDEQARRCVPWIATLVLAAPSRVARSSFFLATWLVEVRAEAAGSGLLSEWQRIVDALVVEGVSRLAPYSE